MPAAPPATTCAAAKHTQSDGRLWCVALVLGYASLLAFASLGLGKTKVLSAAGAIQMSEHFADLSLFAAASHELAMGGDPYLKTPDAWGRAFNYPRLWLVFMCFPMSWVPVVGIGLILTFLGCTLWWLGPLTRSQGILAAAALCSPPLVLAMERGNCDLIIFLLLLLALAALHRGWRAGALLTVFLAFALKLYPAAGYVVFLREGWRRGWMWLAGGIIATTGYAAVRLHEIQLVLKNTPGDLLMSYGSVHWTKVATHWNETGGGRRYAFQHLETLSVLCAGLLFLGALRAGWSKRQHREPCAPDRHLDAFRMGSCLYAITFIAGSSYAYRLVFLLLCMPWLWSNQTINRGTKRVRVVALALIFGIFWINPYWWFPLSLFAEFCGWALLIATGWLLGATLPQWTSREGVLSR